MSWRYDRMLAIYIYNRMYVRLLDWEECVIKTALCRTNDWSHLRILWHLTCRHHLIWIPLSLWHHLILIPLSLLHHLHSPPPSITCHKGKDRRASDQYRNNNLDNLSNRSEGLCQTGGSSARPLICWKAASARFLAAAWSTMGDG